MIGLPSDLRVTFSRLIFVPGTFSDRATAHPVAFESISLAGVGVNTVVNTWSSALNVAGAGQVAPAAGFETPSRSAPRKLPLLENRFVPIIARDWLSPSFG